MFNDKIMFADIPLPAPQVHAKHPFKNQESHDTLLDYIKSRLHRGKQVRDSNINRLVKIDKAIAGWIRLSEDDRQRAVKQATTGIPQAVLVNLPLNFVHIDDMMTYYLQTFAPSRGMFYHTGKPDEATPAQQIVTLMNNHAIYSGYYRELARTLYSVLKYNNGGIHCEWGTDFGPKLSKDAGGADVLTENIVWSGNRAKALDMYNTFWDPHVEAAEAYKDGEFVAKTYMRSHYWFQSRAARGVYFNCEDLLNDYKESSQCTYYRNPPAEANMVPKSGTGTDTDWVSVLSETPEYAKGTGYEFVELYIRLNPYQLNLIPRNSQNKTQRNRMEIWRITLVNNEKIVDITYMNNVHGYLPFFMGTLKEDSMGSSVKSPAEVLQPLQDFASFLLNSHVMATRKNIYGLTIYDPSIVDLNGIPEGEVAARVPAKTTGFGKDMTKAIHKESSVLDTEQTLKDLESVMGIIDKFFPTQSLPSQIAGIDRAITDQVAAVQQGTNRRNQKDARIIDDTMLRPLRFCMYYNIVQYQPDNETVNDFHGRAVTIDLGQLRSTDLPFIIGMGLKAIDMQAAATKLQQIIFALIQNPQAAQQINLLGLIDYWTSLIDIDVDMTQFHIQPPQQQVGPDGQPIAGAPAGGAPTPITAPAAMTAPLAKTGAQ